MRDERAVELQMAHRIEADRQHFGGALPERSALAWGAYLAALLEWGTVGIATYDRLRLLLPPIEGDENPTILEPIEAMWEWSNWTAQKDISAESLATYGDLFARISQPDDLSQIKFALIRPHDVTAARLEQRRPHELVRVQLADTHPVIDQAHDAAVTPRAHGAASSFASHPASRAETPLQ